MLKARKKWISILLTLAMLVGLMVPLAAPASAAVNYSVTPQNVNAGSTNPGYQTYLVITLDPGSVLMNHDGKRDLYLTLPSNPKGYGMKVGTPIVPAQVNGNLNAIESANIVPSQNATEATKGAGDYNEYYLTVTASTYSANAGQIAIPITGLTVPGGVSGDITLTLNAPSNSPFTSGSIVIAKASSGNVTVAAESTPSIGSGGGEIGLIDIKEDTPGAFDRTSSSVKLTLPPGFKWRSASVDQVKWGKLTPGVIGFNDYTTDNNGRDLKLNLSGLNDTYFSEANFIVLRASIDVDESVAKQGDITVTVGGDSTVSPSTLVVGRYGEYGVTVKAESVKDITAGKANTEIGEFSINESLAGSLIAGRTITLTLNGNAVWSTESPKLDDTLTSNYYGSNFDNWVGVGSDGSTIKLTLPSDLATNPSDASKLVFKNLKVTTAPDFSGDLQVTVGGSAIGQETTLTLAKVTPAVNATAASTPDIKIGNQGISVGDFTITENAAGVIDSQATYITQGSDGRVTDQSTANQAQIVLEAPAGVTFTSTPTVAVTSGDLQLDTNNVSTTTTSDGKGQVIIPVKSQSTTPSTITVSNIKLTVDRTVPEGPIYLKVKGSAVNETLDPSSTHPANVFPSNTAAAKAQVGNVVTPAPGESHQNATFTIGSTTYTVNGVQATMDVAAYVKDGRTYLPVRYVAYALGITPENILWDGKTATFIASGRVVQVTPGSAVLTINGAPVTMDAVTEVVNGRVMVPFRWVAQAFGAQVNYDDTTQTVSLSM
ncbi:copper amine oxidase N-terminal domain-containing protein [Neomoorella thermoacetica]|uniref:copper amine oxidase N-terminal domain-containing protein n=1 Tax=Neomoorella thermoacetica TaxID=1525 RepID=UPI0008FB87E5|nr:copper amine oxidase N-terminal domain-containing protein [Moorella thermoacetica]OIQ54186.1 hypothetical protein MORE_17000 [Moorella thermoacetica]